MLDVSAWLGHFGKAEIESAFYISKSMRMVMLGTCVYFRSSVLKECWLGGTPGLYHLPPCCYRVSCPALFPGSCFPWVHIILVVSVDLRCLWNQQVGTYFMDVFKPCRSHEKKLIVVNK